jgi:putative transposase
VLATYIEHYNHKRPHRGRDLHPPNGPPPVVPISPADTVARRDRLGGLIHEYHRKAAA